MAVWLFLTQDPIGLAGGVNLYAYAGNNPIAYADPFGLIPEDEEAGCCKDKKKDTPAQAPAKGPIHDEAYYQNLGRQEQIAASLGIFGALMGPAVDAAGASATDASSVAETTTESTGENLEGSTAYRVYGGDSPAGGSYYTDVNPNTVADYRNAAGLPSGNSGQFVIEAQVRDASNVRVGTAAPLHGNAGGLRQLFFPNPQSQLTVTRVSGANPPF